MPRGRAIDQGRRGWLRDARQRLDERREREARPIPRSREARLVESKRRLEEELEAEREANEAYEAYRARGISRDGRRFGGDPPSPHQVPDTPAGKINTTDPDSRLLKAAGIGYVQGYNAQAAVSEEQIVLAAEISVDSPDFGHLEPMVEATTGELAKAGAPGSPEVVVADAGYWHHEQMDSLAAGGIQVLIPPDAGKRKSARPGALCVIAVRKGKPGCRPPASVRAPGALPCSPPASSTPWRSRAAQKAARRSRRWARQPRRSHKPRA